MGKKIIDPAVFCLPIGTTIFGDLTRVPHFRREKVRLGDPVTKSGVIVEGGIARDALSAGSKGFRGSYPWQKTPVTAHSKDPVRSYQ